MIDSGQRGHKDDSGGPNEPDHVRGLCLVANMTVCKCGHAWVAVTEELSRCSMAFLWAATIPFRRPT
jgi:hypothetical protein